MTHDKVTPQNKDADIPERNAVKRRSRKKTLQNQNMVVTEVAQSCSDHLKGTDLAIH